MATWVVRKMRSAVRVDRSSPTSLVVSSEPGVQSECAHEAWYGCRLVNDSLRARRGEMCEWVDACRRRPSSVGPSPRSYTLYTTPSTARLHACGSTQTETTSRGLGPQSTEKSAVLWLANACIGTRCPDVVLHIMIRVFVCTYPVSK